MYAHLIHREYGELHLEYRFTEGGGVYLPIEFPESTSSIYDIPSSIRLTGAIDRIELQSDGKMIITDYKTGSVLPSLDATGSAFERIKAWRYRMQLTFYALLFARTPRWNAWQQRAFHLFFIEPHPKTGVFHEITEYIQESEVQRLEQLIQAVMRHIYTLDFPDTSQYEPNIHGIRQFEEDLLNGKI